MVQVLQTAGALQIIRTTNGLREEMILPFDGREVSFTTSAGAVAKAVLKVKGKRLEIEKDIPQKEFRGVPKAHIHSVESWSLSHDSRTLKICGHADSLGGVMEFRISGCDIFKRQ
ncbi:MAG: hypothetical protein ACRD33_08295 [Candidatus Acidiferrales bacterium]